MVSVTFVVRAILRCSTGSQSSGLLVSLLYKKQIKEVVHLLKMKFLEGKICVPAETTFLYSFTLMWPCSNCIYMLRGLLQEVSDLCSSSERRKFIPANMFQICLSGAKIQQK